MPGYLEGQSPDHQDVVAIVQHLSGETPLQGEPRARADLDGDGAITATDLWHMMRLVAGEIALPLTPPGIQTVSPLIARPGEALTLTGEDFGTDATQLTARVRTSAGDWTPAPVVTATGTACTLQLPAMPGLTSPTEAVVRVSRGQLVSNQAGFELTPGPVLYSLNTVSGAATPTLALTGRGFDTGAGQVTVRFGDQAVTPATVTSTTGLQVAVPPGLTQPTPVVVRVGGLDSNALPYTPTYTLSGHVVLPNGSPLDPTDLVVVAPGDIAAPVAADGGFTLDLDQAGLVSLEVRDPTGASGQVAQAAPVLAALVHADAATMTVDTASTALWLVLLLAGPLPMAMPDAEIAEIAAALATTPELGTLANRIAQHHPAEPRLLILTRDVAAVRNAVEAALTVARAEITAHLEGGNG